MRQVESAFSWPLGKTEDMKHGSGIKIISFKKNHSYYVLMSYFRV